MDLKDDTFYSEKISIEPDLGDPRNSTWKPLPHPPRTPKRVMMKYRFSAIVPIALALASFNMALALVLAGQARGPFGGEYVLAVNTTDLAHTLTKNHEIVSEIVAIPPVAVSQGPTDSNTSLASGALDAFVADVYYIYLQGICVRFGPNRTGAQSSIGTDLQCADWAQVRNGKSLSVLFPLEDSKPSPELARLTTHTNILANTNNTNASIQIIAKSAASLDSMSRASSTPRKLIISCLMMSLVTSGLSALSALLAIFFPQSRLLIYINIAWPLLGSIIATLGSVVLTAIVAASTSILNLLGAAFSLEIHRGSIALLFVWLTWVLASLQCVYWGGIWFVEVRRWSFIRRRRADEEKGHWRGIGGELLRDYRGEKSL
ncbi:hypothetical protein NX059_008868 [Plenodomus lindquistii]|nr:hypothetical protein NX059_008868 [Plenodomus lindquistii]